MVELLYIESKNHSIEIYLKSGKSIKTYTPLADMKNLFNNVSGFISVGASYIVNLSCVRSVLQTELVLINGQNIPVPRRLRNSIREQYFDFYSEEAIKK